MSGADKADADKIRAYIIARRIKPARRRISNRTVKIRAGDVQRDMALTDQTADVCAVLASGQFLEEAGVNLVEKTGLDGEADAVFIFSFS